MKTEWWYESAIFDSDHSTIALARLTVRDDGTAQILTDGGEAIEFESEDEASIWLTSEEYSPLENLIEELTEQGLPVDPRIKPPTGASQQELLGQMVIRLKAKPQPASQRFSRGTVVMERDTSAPSVLCPNCSAVLGLWVDGQKQQVCQHCGQRVVRL